MKKKTETEEKHFKRSFDVPLRDFFLFWLNQVATELYDKNSSKERTESRKVKTIANYLKRHLLSLEVKGEHPAKPDFELYFKCTPEEEATVATIKAYFSREVSVQFALAKSLGKGEEYLKTINKGNTPIGKFRKSGHLTDQMLKYNYPKDNNPQLSIFETLQEKTKKDIEVAGVEVSEIVEGIKLSPSETKVIDCLCKLLHETSQISDAKKEDYYSGNIGYELEDYGGEKTPAPKLAFTLYELTREYKGGEYVAGKDIENVKQILTELDGKRFLLSYVETTKKKDGGRIERKIEDFRKLIHIIKISETEYSREDVELSKTEETVILLNPIFRRQIDSKFILYPNDINRRTIIAYGSHNLSDIALRLRDWLIRELSSKHYQPEMKLEKLYYFLAEKWMKESRKKKVKDYTDKALQTVKALGLLLSYEVKTASTGEPKIVFTLNKDWE